MRIHAILYYVRLISKLEAVLMLIPLAISLFYGEKAVVLAFTAAIIGIFIIILPFDFIAAKKSLPTEGQTISAQIKGLFIPSQKPAPLFFRESFAAVALCWISLCLFGALPYYLSGTVHSFGNALFESVSGFTTTGASILPTVESMPLGLLFWRSFTLWLGGAGILVFMLAIVPASGEGKGINIVKAESPGPFSAKIVPKLSDSARIIYSIYLALTCVLIILLVIGGMPVFDSVVNAMATTGTGGYTVYDTSIGAYNSTYTKVVIAVFMWLSGMNFNIYFLLLKDRRLTFKNEELRLYIGITLASTLLITLNLFGNIYSSWQESLGTGAFHVVSVITTTAFFTEDFSAWPQFSKAILFILMFTGCCAGSTGGGFKLSRMLIIFKQAKICVLRTVQPRSAAIVKLEGKAIDAHSTHEVNGYCVIYLAAIALSAVIIGFDCADFETAITAVVSSISNVGVGYGSISAGSNFSEFSALSKAVLMADMLLGRLEIYPVLILFSKKAWRQ